MPLIELSHVIEDGMTTYPGLPGPEITEHITFDASHQTYAPGTEFAIGRMRLVANTGTYLDTPAHRFRDGHDLSGLALERCAGLPAIVVDIGDGPTGPEPFAGIAVRGTAVLLRSGWDSRWGTDAYGDPVYQHLTEDVAQALVDAGAAQVGIDSLNIDDTTTGERPAHTTLLRAGIPIVEHLTNLVALPATGALFSAVPPRIHGMATFPVRAFAGLP
jgi:kynurenine formamidase